MLYHRQEIQTNLNSFRSFTIELRNCYSIKAFKNDFSYRHCYKNICSDPEFARIYKFYNFWLSRYKHMHRYLIDKNSIVL